MNEVDPPRVMPGKIDMLEEHWLMYGKKESDEKWYCEYAKINWTESTNATKYDIYYFSSPEEISFSEARDKSIFFKSVYKSGNYTVDFYKNYILLDYWNNYTYITVIPVTVQTDKNNQKLFENKGTPLTCYWSPGKNEQ